MTKWKVEMAKWKSGRQGAKGASQGRGLPLDCHGARIGRRFYRLWSDGFRVASSECGVPISGGGSLSERRLPIAEWRHPSEPVLSDGRSGATMPGADLDSLNLSGIMHLMVSGATGGSCPVTRRNEFSKGVVCAI
jgi:hypothetical protein